MSRNLSSATTLESSQAIALSVQYVASPFPSESGEKHPTSRSNPKRSPVKPDPANTAVVYPLAARIEGIDGSFASIGW